MGAHTNRVVVLVDMDCFYCQVEEKLNPTLQNKPIAVVQYNQWRGGGIIAVNYAARDRGVTRHMRGNEAKEKCPEIELVRVPNIRGKADLTKYREAGKRVAEVLQTFTTLLERASVDEAYLDITESVEKRLAHMVRKLTIDSVENTHVVGAETPDFLHNAYENEFENECELKLLIGAAIVEEIRAAVYERTGYRCSAGIAHNKILAKLACGINKPNKQTILPQNSIQELFQNLPVKKIKSLGGKFGVSLTEHLHINYMGDLVGFSERELIKQFDEKTGSWLFNICRGIDLDPVTVRLVSKSIGCCKKFPGKTALKTIEDVSHWIAELSTEIAERLEQDIEENNRRAKQMVLSFAQPSNNRKDVNTTKSLNLNSYESSKIMGDALETLKKMAQKSDGSFCLTFLGLSVGKFEDTKNQNDISVFFKNVANKTEPKTKTNQDISGFFKTNDSLGKTFDSKINDNLIKTFDSKTNDNLTKTFDSKTNDSLTKINDGIKYDSKTNDVTTFDSKSDKTNVTKRKSCQNMSDFLKNTPANKTELNLDEIEDDADNDEINLNDTLTDMRNIKSVFDEENDDSYSNTTIEVDYSSQLENKEEFPHFVAEKPTPASPKNEQIDTSKSFFIKYLNNSENTVFTPPSAIDQQLAGCSYQYVSPVPKTEIICHDSNSSSNFGDDAICPECSKKINHIDFISHMDQHLAERLMAEEREIFQIEFQAKKQLIQQKTKITNTTTTNNNTTTNNKNNNNPKNNNNKTVKRKPLDRNLSITSFLTQNQADDNAVTQICPECDRKIRVEEFACHLDYHAAKKLHLELNPVKSETPILPKASPKAKSVVNKNSCKKSNGIASISNYFKSVEN